MTAGNIIGIPGSISQMKTLIRYFLVAVMSALRDDFKEAMEHESYLMLVELSRMVRLYNSFAITESQVRQLRTTYDKYLELRLKVGEELKALHEEQLTKAQNEARFGLKPKHMVVYWYPDFVEVLGPLGYYSSLVSFELQSYCSSAVHHYIPHSVAFEHFTSSFISRHYLYY